MVVQGGEVAHPPGPPRLTGSGSQDGAKEAPGSSLGIIFEDFGLILLTSGLYADHFFDKFDHFFGRS